MSDELQSAEKPERTIEELCEYTTEQLLSMTAEELESWISDSLTRQDEILGKLPKSSSGPRAVSLTTRQHKRVALQERNTLAKMPDDLQEMWRKNQEMLDKIKREGRI